MSVLTEHIVLSRSKEHDLCSIKKLNCWGSNLTDISIIRKMKIVEVLSLSLNNIASLADFAYCSCLKELYLRKNNIENLSELHHLKDLEHLHSLLLEDNPCTKQQNYRFTVLRILPNLKVLDNICVNPDEVEKAMACGDTLQYSNSPSPLLQLSIGAMDSNSENVLSTNTGAQNFSEIDCGFRHISSNCIQIDKHAYNSEVETLSRCNEISVIPCKKKISIHQEAFHAKVQTMVDHPMPEAEGMSCIDICSICLEVSPLELIATKADAVGCISVPPSDVKRGSLQMCSSFPKEETVANVQDFIVSSSKEIFLGDDNLPSSITQKNWKTMNSNLVSAVLCLVKELDYASLEVVKNAILCRMDEME